MSDCRCCRIARDRTRVAKPFCRVWHWTCRRRGVVERVHSSIQNKTCIDLSASVGVPWSQNEMHSNSLLLWPSPATQFFDRPLTAADKTSLQATRCKPGVLQNLVTILVQFAVSIDWKGLTRSRTWAMTNIVSERSKVMFGHQVF